MRTRTIILLAALFMAALGACVEASPEASNGADTDGISDEPATKYVGIYRGVLASVGGRRVFIFDDPDNGARCYVTSNTLYGGPSISCMRR